MRSTKKPELLLKQWGASHGLTPAQLGRMKTRRMLKDEASRVLKASAPADGFYIPYFDLNGKLTGMCRVRFDEYASFVKPIRYRQPTGSEVAAYFPPLVSWKKIANNTGFPLVMVEGELKAACACAHDIPCIGLGGVASWRGTKHGTALLPDLQDIVWKDRDVAIAYDSDAATNPSVLREECLLADALIDAGARVKIVRLPADGDKKMGVDDYIKKHGAEALKKLIAETDEAALSCAMRDLTVQYVYVRELSSVAEVATGRLWPPRVFMNEVEVARKTSDLDANGKPRLVSAAKKWFESPSRPAVERLTYQPGQEWIVTNGSTYELNLWVPSGIEPRAGDIKPFTALLKHLISDPAEREHALCWFAAPLQRPGLKLATALVLWGAIEGTGKTLLGTTIGRLHGDSNYIEIGQAELGSPFNDWQQGKTYVMGSELCGERDSRAVADRLKTIITGEEVLINRKFVAPYKLRNCANYFLTSNHPNAVYIGEHARRFNVIHTENGPLPAQFYKDYGEWLNGGGLAAIFDHLLHKDISAFNPKAHALRNEAREEMIGASRTLVQEWCHELRVNTDTALAVGNSTKEGMFFTTRELLDIFSRGEQTRLTEKGLANALRAEGFKPANDGNPIMIPGTVLRLRLWVVRNELRAANMRPTQIGEAYMRQRQQWERGWKHASR